MALIISGRPLIKRALVVATGYSDKTVKRAVDHLVSLGFVCQVGRRGWTIDPCFRLFLAPYLLGRDPSSPNGRPNQYAPFQHPLICHSQFTIANS